MTDEQTGPAQVPAGETAQPSRAPGRALAVLAFLVALAALAGSAYQFSRRGELDSRSAIAGLEARAASLARENEGLETALAAQRARIDGLKSELAALRAAMDSLEDDAAPDNVDFALAEIEYLLIIATQRLALARDVETALAAVEAADRRLVGLEAPALTELRAQLASDMHALRAVPEVDIAGLALFLADLVQRADTLPLRDEYLRRREAASGRPAVSESARGWRGFWQGIWHEISRHMLITRADKGARVTLLPEEKYFLVHNLRLQLETARLAALRADTGSLHASLGIATDWMQKYYNTGDPAVANALESLRRMQSLRLDPELPDISSSLESVRALLREQSRTGSGTPQS